jgi:hypothetical protein
MAEPIWGVDDPLTQTAARSAALQKSGYIALYRDQQRTHLVVTAQGQQRLAKTMIALFALLVVFNVLRWTHDCVFSWSTTGTCANRIDWQEIRRREQLVRGLSDSLASDNVNSHIVAKKQAILTTNNWASTLQAVNLRVAPDRNSDIVLVLQEGARIEILSLVRGWAEVQTVKGINRGWITQSAIALDSDSGIGDDRIDPSAPRDEPTTRLDSASRLEHTPILESAVERHTE